MNAGTGKENDSKHGAALRLLTFHFFGLCSADDHKFKLVLIVYIAEMGIESDFFLILIDVEVLLQASFFLRN